MTHLEDVIPKPLTSAKFPQLLFVSATVVEGYVIKSHKNENDATFPNGVPLLPSLRKINRQLIQKPESQIEVHSTVVNLIV